MADRAKPVAVPVVEGVTLCGITLGNDLPCTPISNTCQTESREHALTMAREVSAL